MAEQCDLTYVWQGIGQAKKLVEISQASLTRSANALSRSKELADIPPPPVGRLHRSRRSWMAAERSVECGHRQELSRLEHDVVTLQRALASRETIGMAKGILMARSNCTPEQAFDMLRRASQRTNRKLAAIAGEIVESNSCH